MNSWIPAELLRLLLEAPGLERAFLVGGCVRDWLLGRPVKDFDVEVYGVSYDQLAESLRRWGRTDMVGRSFGVVKLTTSAGATYDFTIPRRDSKTGPGHKGFEVDFDPEISLREAASRRDFTINSLMFDPRTSEIADFFGGRADLDQKILRHTSSAFTEDPLRVLRGMQFAARFDLTAAPETIELCRSIKESYAELAVERVREEWFKWAAKSVKPSRGIHFLKETGWLEHYPEIVALQGTPQDPEWHPEGDVFIHTCHCCDAMAGLSAWREADEETRIVLALAILAHDFGKAQTTEAVIRDGQRRIISPGHEDVGVALAQRFLERINTPIAIAERVYPLVRNHMSHIMNVSDRSVRRLSKRMEPETIFNLCILMTADSMGRPPRPAQPPAIVEELRAKAVELKVQNSAPQPIVMGRHLLDLGMRPGPEIGAITRAAYDAQLEGKFFNLEEALAWLGGQAMVPLSSDVLAKIRQV